MKKRKLVILFAVLVVAGTLALGIAQAYASSRNYYVQSEDGKLHYYQDGNETNIVVTPGPNFDWNTVD